MKSRAIRCDCAKRGQCSLGERGKRSYSQTYSNATSIYTHHTSSSNPTYRSKRLRHLAWQAFPCSYTVGAADPDELTLYDGWQSTTCGSFYLCVIKSSEPIDAWTWLDNPDVMGGGQRRDRIAVLAGNKVSIYDDVLSGKYRARKRGCGGFFVAGRGCGEVEANRPFAWRRWSSSFCCCLDRAMLAGTNTLSDRGGPWVERDAGDASERARAAEGEEESERQRGGGWGHCYGRRGRVSGRAGR